MHDALWGMAVVIAFLVGDVVGRKAAEIRAEREQLQRQVRGERPEVDE